MPLDPNIHNSWDATKRAAAALCQDLWADPGHPCSADLLNRIGEVRAAIHRSAEVTRQPPGAVVTVHGDLDRAASQWSERGSDLHRAAQAEAERAQAAKQAAAVQAAKAARVAKGLPADWRSIEVKPGVLTVLEAPWSEFQGGSLDEFGVMWWFDDDLTPTTHGGAGTGEIVRKVLDLRHAIATAQ